METILFTMCYFGAVMFIVTALALTVSALRQRLKCRARDRMLRERAYVTRYGAERRRAPCK